MKTRRELVKSVPEKFIRNFIEEDMAKYYFEAPTPVTPAGKGKAEKKARQKSKQKV